MKALVFGVDPGAVPEIAAGADRLARHLATTPMALQDIETPALPADDWLLLRPRMTGICGSDAKQVLMDFEDAADSPMTALISFPQVLGHEVVATVDHVGPAVTAVEPGQRVVLNPWLTCAPRGIDPICPACRAGDLSLCQSFTEGHLAAGIHSGTSSDGTGGFAELLPAHESMAIPVNADIPDEVAVLADPASVSMHGVTRNPPPEGGCAVVYGAGALGTCAISLLRTLYPTVRVAAVARWPAQAALATRLGAHVVGADDPAAITEELARWSGGVLRQPWGGLPMAHPGGVDVVYDTVGAPGTVEVAIRLLASRGTLVQLGVSSPGRFEWTPWYFKELRLVGSNAFGVEEIDGVRAHAISHYLDLVRNRGLDLEGMLTHTFRLEDWRDAFGALVDQAHSGAIKVAFDFR